MDANFLSTRHKAASIMSSSLTFMLGIKLSNHKSVVHDLKRTEMSRAFES